MSANPNDTQSAARLKTAALVVQMDPFQRQISVAQRDRIVLEAFAAAGQRLESCSAVGAAKGPATIPAAQSGLSDEWAKMKPQITQSGLRRDPDLVNTAMELVFSIERQTSNACGAASETDAALLLIAKLHESN